MNLNLILILVTKLFFIASGLARPQRCSAPFYCATDSVQLQPIPHQTYSNDQFNLLQKVSKIHRIILAYHWNHLTIAIFLTIQVCNPPKLLVNGKCISPGTSSSEENSDQLIISV